MGSSINRSYSEGIKWRTWQIFLGLLVLILGGVNVIFCFNNHLFATNFQYDHCAYVNFDTMHTWVLKYIVVFIEEH